MDPMVDKIDKIDPNFYRVQESGNDRGRRQHPSQEDEEKEKKEKERDQFAKVNSGWNKMDTDPRIRIPSVMANPLTHPPVTKEYPVPEKPEKKEDESSLTLGRRLMIVWGVVDITGKPKTTVILAYLLVLSVIITSVILMMRLLWR